MNDNHANIATATDKAKRRLFWSPLTEESMAMKVKENKIGPAYEVCPPKVHVKCHRVGRCHGLDKNAFPICRLRSV